ncbi:unnamed protein product [Mycena citricolor]|uniref:Protein kinase domain-containing protein n=1 Tax=Mycena citricolor TaxID=2018698 RepID=A0AAD2HV19_9AGAR|nr:unnamed protein product [Mycena citricolor]CAK5281630.1 unnamed protein product [Mycena citricolor]
MPSSSQVPIHKSPVPAPMLSSDSNATLKGYSQSSLGHRPRGRSTSSLLSPLSPLSSSQGQGTTRLPGRLSHSRTASTPVTPPPSYIDECSFPFHDAPTSSFLARARSHCQTRASFASAGMASPKANLEESVSRPAGHPTSPTPTSWWGRNFREEILPRPWRDSPKRQGTVPAEQTDSWARTQKRVSLAVTNVLGTSVLLSHEILLRASELMEVIPIPVPGLQMAAKCLLSIWDDVQGVDLNRMACLRLAERCADILMSVREEIRDAGDEVGHELTAPIEKLNSTFERVHLFMSKQAQRPFLKRYLRRAEILREIVGCDKALGEALSLFGLSIQIRILKQVQAVEFNRHNDTLAILDSVVNSQQIACAAGSTSVTIQGLGISIPSGTNGLPPSSSHKSLSAAGGQEPVILPTLHNLHDRQNTLDRVHDMTDLRDLMRNAVSQSSDAEMLRVLQVRRDDMPEALKTLQRALERIGIVNSLTSSCIPSPLIAESCSEQAQVSVGPEPVERTISASSSGSSVCGGLTADNHDMLDREFLESGIDALRRLSKPGELGLPSWTITRYEVDLDERIGMGFFSDVHRGLWRGRVVAIKVLAECTPQKLFLKEIGIWKELKHPHVLELYGASAATGDGPWFFVCPYEKNGCLNAYLRQTYGSLEDSRERFSSVPSGHLSGLGSASTRPRHISAPAGYPVKEEPDLLRFIHEIAKGMDYLHGQGVLHGDLKVLVGCANILVNDNLHCLVSDFGQSELKSEVFRISGTGTPHGTLRWQAPELMLGHCQLTPAMDIYAFAMCCVEILTLGKMPWPLSDDEDVRYFVIKENTRPQVPLSRNTTAEFMKLLGACWDWDAAVRPLFAQIVDELRVIRRNLGGAMSAGEDIPGMKTPRLPDWSIDEEDRLSRQSPDMHPISTLGDPSRAFSIAGALPFLTRSSTPSTGTNSVNTSFHTAQLEESFADVSLEETVPSQTSSHSEEILFTPSHGDSVATEVSSSTDDTSNTLSSVPDDEEKAFVPTDPRTMELWNERRYRLLLNHDFHPSLTLPLWSPAPISLGAVGYLSKPSGEFVTLLNCFSPEVSDEGLLDNLPSVHGYGHVSCGGQRQDKRNAAQRGLDAIAGLLTFKTKHEGPVSQNVSRRYSYPLRAGHKAAYMCTETTMYRYVDSLDAPKKWFKAHVDSIIRTYGPIHQIQKEDLFLVIGTLGSPEYGLFVSHKHPDGQAHFNIFSSLKCGHAWGTFTTDNGLEIAGPSYHEPVVGHPLSASKVSFHDTSNSTWDTLLVARLRFKPDVAEPTSL